MCFLALDGALSVALFAPGSGPGLSPLFLQHAALVQALAPVGILVVCLVSLGILRWLGVPWRAMGLGRGYHSWRVAFIGGSVPLGVLAVFLALGHFSGPTLGLPVGKAFFLAALPEELFFRGALLTRLVRLLGQPWGMGVALGLFALLHLEVDLRQDGSLLLALTDLVLTQAVAGLLLIVVFVRTRSVLSGVVLHTILDTFGALFRF